MVKICRIYPTVVQIPARIVLADVHPSPNYRKRTTPLDLILPKPDGDEYGLGTYGQHSLPPHPQETRHISGRYFSARKESHTGHVSILLLDRKRDGIYGKAF